MTEDRLRSLFSVNGTITECSLKYTRDGVFRKFAFVGFKDADSAAAAVKHFNRAYIDTSKIAVSLSKCTFRAVKACSFFARAMKKSSENVSFCLHVKSRTQENRRTSKIMKPSCPFSHGVSNCSVRQKVPTINGVSCPLRLKLPRTSAMLPNHARGANIPGTVLRMQR